MPTDLPPRREPPPSGEPDDRIFAVALAVLLLSGVGLLCEYWFGPTPGFSLAEHAGDLQLSP